MALVSRALLPFRPRSPADEAARNAELLFGDLLAGLWLALVGWYLTSAATIEQSSDLLRDQLTGVTVRDAALPALTSLDHPDVDS